jgi:hypothetical protein
MRAAGAHFRIGVGEQAGVGVDHVGIVPSVWDAGA